MTVLPNQKEKILGIVYVLAQYSLVPSLLTYMNGSLSRPLSDGQLNFCFFLLNFLFTVLIFRRFLKDSLAPLKENFKQSLLIVLMGFLLGTLSQALVGALIRHLLPDFLNHNDQSIGAMARGDFLLTAMGTVLLVPPAEECIHRGLIFGGLHDKYPRSAYLSSAAIFASIHVLGYLGTYSGLQLAAAFSQYLLPGLILAWSYEKTNTIYVPIVIHALINLKGMLLLL